MNEESQNSGMGDQLKALVSSLTQAVGPAKPFNKSEKDKGDSTSKLYEDLKKVQSDIEQSVKENRNLVKKIADLIKGMSSRERKGSTPVVKDVASGPLTRDASSALSKLSANQQKVAPIEAKFFKAGLQKGSIFTHDLHIVKELEKLNATALEVRDCLCGEKKERAEKKLVLPDDIESPTPIIPDNSSEGPSLEDAEEALKLRFQELFVLKRYREVIADVSKTAAKIQESLMGFTAFNKITEDLVKQEREFAQQVRGVAYETMGVTKESRQLQHALTEIGESSSITGFNRTETEKSYVNNLKRGIRDQKTALKLSKTQLNTEKLIGLEAGGLGETFGDMSLQMNMTTHQMMDFGRGVKNVARDTGVTGQNLANAVKSSESIMKNYRNAANFNADAAKSAVGIMASAEKFGVSEGVGEIMSTVSQGLHGIANASSQTQTLLYQAANSVGKLGELQSGTWLQTKEGMKSAAQGIENIIERFSGVSLDQIENLTAEQRSVIDFQMRSATGRGLGELMQMNKAFMEQGKTLQDKLMDINKERQKNLTLEEKNTLLEQERSLKTSSTLDVLSKLNESAKGAKSMEQALSGFQDKLPGMSEDLKALGISDKDAKSAGRDALRAAIDGVNQGLKKAGKQELKVGTKDIEKAMNDPEAFRTLTEEIEKKNQELGVSQKSQTDVLTDMNQTLTELNDTLRGRIQGFLGNLLDSTLGKFMYFTAAAAGGMMDIAWKATDIAVHIKENEILREAAEKGLTKFLGHFGLGIEGLGASASAAFSPAALAAARTALATVAVGVTAVVAAAGAIYGSISAGEKAAELFDKQMEEVTMAEFYAAKGAGAVTGALNFLTFGIFDSFLGSTGVVTKWLAQFNKMIPILSAIVAVIDIVAGAIWGIVLSIKDVFVGAFEMVYLILEPFGALISGIGDAIGIVLSPLFSFTSGLSNTGSLFKVFADIFGVFGKVLRGIMRTIGFIIGGLLKIFVGILVPLIKAVAYFLSIFTNIVGYVFNTIAEGVMGILEFFQGLFTLDFAKMGRGLWNVFSTLIMGIPNLILRIISGIPSFITNGLIGIGSSILGAVTGAFTSVGEWIVGFFSEIPSNIYSALYSAASAVGLGWLVEGIGGKPKDKQAEQGFDAMKKMAEEGTKKGSLYTHDIYLERQLMALNGMLAFSDMGGALTGLIGSISNIGGYISKSIGSVFSGIHSKLTGTASAVTSSMPSLDFSDIKNSYTEFKKGFFDSSFFKGISSRYKSFTDTISGSVEKNLTEPAKGLFAPLTKGFTRAREEGKSLTESLSRGVKGQYMSSTKGGLFKDGSKLGDLKKSALEKYDFAKEGLFGSKKGEEVKKGLLQKAKDGIFGEKADFSKGIAGKKGLLDAAKSKYSDVKDKVFGKVDGMGIKKKGLIDEAKSKAGSYYQGAKDKIFGKKLGEGEYGPQAPGLIDKAKSKAKGWMDAGKEKLGFGKKDAEALDGVSTAGNKMGTMEKVKEGLKNLAEGLKHLAGRDVLFGALNLIPASIGMTSMVVGYVGANLVSKLDGEALKSGLTGLAEGLKTMASAKVLLGALALIPASLGFTLLLPGLAGMALLGFVGPLAQAGLTALASGLTSFGTAAMNPMFWLGLAALAAFNVALIPLAFSLSLLSPLVESFGKAIKSAFEGVAAVVDSVIGGLTGFISVMSLEKAAGIVAVAGALGILSLAVVAFGASVAGGGILSFFGGNGILDKILLLSVAGQNLMVTATAMKMLTDGVKSFDQNLDSFLSKSDKIEQFAGVINQMKEATSSSGILSSLLSPMDTISNSLIPKPPVVANTAKENIQDMVQRDVVSSEPINKVEGSELGALTEEGKTQTQKLIEAVSLLQEIAESLRPSSSSGNSNQIAADTSAVASPIKPAAFYPWSTGQNKDLAGLALRKA
jgi:hypothetical protein